MHLDAMLGLIHIHSHSYKLGMRTAMFQKPINGFSIYFEFAQRGFQTSCIRYSTSSLEIDMMAWA